MRFLISFLIAGVVIFFPEILSTCALISRFCRYAWHCVRARRAAVGLMNLGWSLHQRGNPVGERVYFLGAYALEILPHMNPSARVPYREMRRQFGFGGEKK